MIVPFSAGTSRSVAQPQKSVPGGPPPSVGSYFRAAYVSKARSDAWLTAQRQQMTTA